MLSIPRHDGLNGRWLAPDPVAGDTSDPGSLNRYTYVLNDPVNFVDPMGLSGGRPPHVPPPIPPMPPGGPGTFPSPWGNCDPAFAMMYPELCAPIPGDPGQVTPQPVAPGCTPSGCSGQGGSGSSGGQAPPEPKTDHKEQQQLVNEALSDLFPKLLVDFECLSFLHGGGKSPIVEASLATFSVTKLPPNVGAQTYVEDLLVQINRSGAFFSGRSYAGGIFQGGTNQARQLILIHEIGHLTGAIVPERGSQVQQDANNLAILTHCQKALGIKN